MTKKKYTWLRVGEDAKKQLDERLKHINTVDLPKIGIKHKEIKQIDLTRYLFKNKVYISDRDLLRLAKKRNKGKKC